MAEKKDLRVGRQIRINEVFVIDDTGAQRGVMRTFDALNLADELGLDLVEISPNAHPPVCKIIDYGKYRYEMEKKNREAKKNQAVTKLKEVRMQVKVDVGDLNTKCRFISEFLEERNKVKVSVRFRGREMQHSSLAFDLANRFIADLANDPVTVEKKPMVEGRNVTAWLAPQN